MERVNKKLSEASKKIESEIIDAVINNKCTINLISKVEVLYKLGYLTKNDFNFLTDIEQIKKIYS